MPYVATEEFSFRATRYAKGSEVDTSKMSDEMVQKLVANGRLVEATSSGNTNVSGGGQQQNTGVQTNVSGSPQGESGSGGSGVAERSG